MAHAPTLSLSLLDADDDFGTLDAVTAEPAEVFAYDAAFAALSDGLISMSLLDDEPQRIAG